jgi:hypothetical protein
MNLEIKSRKVSETKSKRKFKSKGKSKVKVKVEEQTVPLPEETEEESSEEETESESESSDEEPILQEKVPKKRKQTAEVTAKRIKKKRQRINVIDITKPDIHLGDMFNTQISKDKPQEVKSEAKVKQRTVSLICFM